MLSSLVRLSCVAAALFGLATATHAQSVGYQHLTMPDPSGAPVEIGVWYPTGAAPKPSPVGSFSQMVAENAAPSGHGLPLVVMSHGTGGEFAGHYDTALALAHAGYVVAALTHTGDNYRDQSRAVDLPNRPRQLKLLVDYMLSGWSGHAVIDPERVGAFGFSAGGFTVLAAAGGEPDLGAFVPHCQAHPQYFDCQLITRFPAMAKMMQSAKPTWVHDDRLKAVVVAAPAVGFAFGKTGLAHVHAPMQLWGAEFDHILPVADYAGVVRADLPNAPDYRLVNNADHFDFLAPCSVVLSKQVTEICVSRPGFDRAQFHAEFDKAVVAFFDKYLKG
jgi:predicted dienelactone hydrolase